MPRGTKLDAIRKMLHLLYSSSSRDAGTVKTYDAYERQTMARVVPLGQAVGTLGVFMFLLLDQVVYPDYVTELFWIRAASIALVWSLNGACHTNWYRRKPWIAIYWIELSLTLPVVWMTVIVGGGFISTYYLGTVLVISSGMSVIPYYPRHHFGSSVVTITVYIAGNNFYYRDPVAFVAVFEQLWWIVWFLSSALVGLSINGYGRRLFFEENRKLMRRITREATHDELTGLSNRRHFNEELNRSLAMAKRYKHKAALLFIDLDGFKQINDRLGHSAGDKTLRHVAKVIQHSVRDSDILARLGGDEFVVYLPEITGTRETANVAGKIIKAISKPLTIASSKVSVTGSIGIAIYPTCATKPDGLMRSADRAMYCAKDGGKNRYQFDKRCRAGNMALSG